MALKLQDLIIDIPSMFKNDILLISEGRPFYKYVDGVKTDEVGGISYEIVNTGLHFEKVSVKVTGETRPSVKYDGAPIKVVFNNLDGRAYQDFKHGGEIKLSLTATAISQSETKTLKINKEVG